MIAMEQTGEVLTEAELKKRLKESEKKMIKMRNENQQLKQDLEKAQRVLEKEVGEVVDIEQMLKEGTTWKGRAQKIENLKAKIKALNEKVWREHVGYVRRHRRHPEDPRRAQFRKT